MSSEELQELHEHAEHAKHDPTVAPVSVTMAILAVMVAAISLLGHRAHTEEILLQSKASDQWAYYQAKNIRRHNDELFASLTAVTPAKDADQLDRLREKYSQEADRYRDEQKDIEAEARKLESEVASERRRADRYDLGEVFLDVALVITSITLLTGRRIYWRLGMVLGIVGLIVAGSGWVIH